MFPCKRLLKNSNATHNIKFLQYQCNDVSFSVDLVIVCLFLLMPSALFIIEENFNWILIKI